MNRIDRLVAMMVLLQSKKVITGKEIANHFGISLRTVYRDINAICEAGVPVAAEAGIGYSIISGYHLPPVMFTEDEANALFTGAKLAGTLTDRSIETHARSAMLKIQSVLPENSKNRLEKLDKTMALPKHPSRSMGFRDDVLLKVQEAVVNQQVLEIEYYVAAKDRLNIRKIEPLAIVYYAGRWHIIAWCRLRDAQRDFRTDRIKSVKITMENFDLHHDFSLDEYLYHFARSDDPIEVTICVPKPTYYMLKERFPVILSEKVGEKSVELVIPTPKLEWLIPDFLVFGKEITIIKPARLKELLSAHATQIAAHYSK